MTDKDFQAVFPDDQNGFIPRILAAAKDCFERFGIGRTTMVDIAKAAGISRASLYNYFPSKDKIVEHIGLAEVDAIYLDLHKTWNPDGTFADRVTETMCLSLMLAKDNSFVRWFIRDPELRRIAQSSSSVVSVARHSRWMRLIETGRAKGEVAPHIRDEDIIFWLSLCNVALMFQLDQAPMRDDRLRYYVRNFVVHPISAEGGAAIPPFALSPFDGPELDLN